MLIRSSVHIRNILITFLALACIGLLASYTLTRPAEAEHGAAQLATPPGPSSSWRPGDDTISIKPGHSVEYFVAYTNKQTRTQDFQIAIDTPEALLPGWRVSVFPTTLEAVQPGERRIVTLSLGIPETAQPGFSDLVLLNASGTHNPDHIETFRLRILVEGRIGSVPTNTLSPTFDPALMLNHPLTPTPTSISRAEAALKERQQQPRPAQWNPVSDTVTIDPGQTINYNAQFQNGTTTAQDFNLSVLNSADLPAGWQVNINPTSLTNVAPGTDVRDVTVAISAPDTATAGTTFPLTINAEGQQTQETQELGLNLTVREPQQAQITWDFPGGTDITIPADATSNEVAATLTSTVSDTFDITTNIGDFPGWVAQVNPPSISLEAGQPGDVTFAITPPADVVPGDTIALALNASSPSGNAPVQVLNITVEQQDEPPDEPEPPADAAFTWEPASSNISLAPGQSQLTSSNLTSTVSGTVQLTTNIASFPGWSITLDPQSVDLVADEPANIAFTVTAPATAAPGDSVAIQVTPQLSGLAQQPATFTINATVIEQTAPSLTWTFAQGTSVVIGEADDNVRVPSQLTSTVEDTYLIETNIANFPGWTLSLDPGNSVDIAENQTVDLNFTITPPDDAEGGDTIQLNVSATGATSGLVQQEVLTVSVEQAEIPDDLEVRLTSPDPTKEGEAGNEVTYEVRIRNRGSETGTFRVQVVRSCLEDLENCDDFVEGDTEFDIDAGASRTFDVIVQLPEDAPDTEVTTTVRGWLVADENIRDSIDLETDVRPRPTETPTNTPSLTPSPTFAPICRDNYEDDDTFDDAVEIGFNLSQPRLQETVTRLPEQGDDRRAICPQGDEDWLKFGAVKGKVYTIDILEMAPGLDLSLELYDENRRRLAFNDDFFNRTPNPDPANPALPREDLSPVPNDIMPRIDSWEAPHTGQYYIRVRDAVGGGGLDWTYVIAVLSESYGPTPPTVDEVCLDIYEPDGLPEEARLIVSNERQERRRLCPTGDADWVTFFGKAGKRYFIYTNTDRYTDNNPANNNQAEAGADTFLTLTDRDGVTILDTNDDIPGGNTLDSQIEFFPEVDGFYFVQVKNIGDIGNQFIRYDLVLELCIPGDPECGRVPTEARSLSMPTRVAGVPPQPTPAPVAVAAPAVYPEEMVQPVPAPAATPTLTP